MKIKEFWEKDETLEEKYNKKNNIFNYIKIIFAILVIFNHCYPLFFGAISKDPITERLLRTETLGGVAVIGFFLLSGFFITQSLEKSKNAKEFVGKRISRIFPSLILMLLITILIIAPLGYEGEKGQYFNVSVSRYFFGNLNLFGNTVYSIENVFTSNVYPSAINGSIWTLKHEFLAYFVLMLIAFCDGLKNRKKMLGITALTVAMYLLNLKLKLNVNFLKHMGALNELDNFLKLIMYFFVGSSIYLYRDKIKMNAKTALLMALIFLFGMAINGTKYVLLAAFPYLLFYIGTFQLKKDYLGKLGDFSYGIYVYAFPIQQLIIHFLKDKINIFEYIGLSIIITVIVAILTTMLISAISKGAKKFLKKNKTNEIVKVS